MGKVIPPIELEELREEREARRRAEAEAEAERKEQEYRDTWLDPDRLRRCQRDADAPAMWLVENKKDGDD